MMLYSQEKGTLKADDGSAIGITIQHVNIDPKVAEQVFSRGVNVGDWYWKHKVWFCANEIDLMLVQAAARFYYGWDENSEKITESGSGYRYEAWYAC
jgi:hypothetical protein